MLTQLGKDNEADNTSLNLDAEQEDILLMNDRLPPAISYHQNEDEAPHYPEVLIATH